ncbi:hypothetical protein BRADI_1g34667v3 [Brachypodium distachyon]|uniref:TF-B3 domain-containing protein n=1 Tax=Brachypodium distachyon TaxID=15368 RepID=A0A2K2DMP6_BRADI|nr:hypothetical protein BRADI_1g34667v3 [Brachypodium distachyon]
MLHWKIAQLCKDKLHLKMTGGQFYDIFINQISNKVYLTGQWEILAKVYGMSTGETLLHWSLTTTTVTTSST